MNERIGWSPREFWAATVNELEMAIDGASGRFRPGPFISRERVAEIARAHGRRKSIRDRQASADGRAADRLPGDSVGMEAR